MPLGFIYHEDFLLHDTGPGHPERPQRLIAVRKALETLEKTGALGNLQRPAFGPATAEQLAWVHDPDYIRQVQEACRAGRHRLDADTTICPASYDIACLAAGGVLAAVEAVMSPAGPRRVFCAPRPPGHHAERDRAMGFCLFNNVAIGAECFIRRHNLARVAIVDFDVHHGNGTQHIFEERSDVLFISIHEDPRHLYPGTGHASETGRGPGQGFTLNVPMEPGSGDEEYRRAFQEKILPRLESHRPQALLVSAGFDAAKEDPLAHIELTEAAFAWMTRSLVEVAQRHCNGRLVSVLEGGYDLESLGRCVAAHVKELA